MEEHEIPTDSVLYANFTS